MIVPNRGRFDLHESNLPLKLFHKKRKRWLTTTIFPPFHVIMELCKTINIITISIITNFWVCQIKCVNFFDFLSAVGFDRRFYIFMDFHNY